MKNEKRFINVAVVQDPPVFLNLKATIEKAEKIMKQAAKEETDLIVFPETWLPCYPVWIDSSPNAAIWGHQPAKSLFKVLYKNSIEVPGNELVKLLALAKKYKMYAVIGINEVDKGTIYNSLLYLDKDGRNYTIHRKLVPTYTERMVWGRGDGSGLKVHNTDFGVLGGLICWEHWMPLTRSYMHSFNETIHAAVWPSVHDVHLLASRHYAFEGRTFVAAAGTYLTKGDVLEGWKSLKLKNEAGIELLESLPGKEGEVIMCGGSTVIAPDSKLLIEQNLKGPGIFYARVDTERIIEEKLNLDTDGHYSRPDVFKLEVKS